MTSEPDDDPLDAVRDIMECTRAHLSNGKSWTMSKAAMVVLSSGKVVRTDRLSVGDVLKCGLIVVRTS